MGLRKKILLSMVTLLLLLGLTIAFITHTILLKVLKTEFQHKGLSLSQSISANSIVDVLTQNTSRLNKLIENEKRLDTDIAYIFITDISGRILVHTFDKGFPRDLAKVNSLKESHDANVQALDTQLGYVYDIAAPIFSEQSLLGQVRVGILQNRIQRTINAINLIFLSTTLLIIFIGILLAYKLSSLITKPISQLLEATQSIQKGDFSAKIDIRTKDEIELLAAAFNEMISRLNQMVEEKKRLTVAEERDRIALDFHDGCAQDLANIIKRLELSSKLFKIDPAAAQEELNALREAAKNTLNRVREVIFDLKSPDDIDFDLLSRLNIFIKYFEMMNNITVKLDVSGKINNLLPAKSKPIFYIITEAITNIRKHAQAKNIELCLKCNGEDELSIDIKDDGQGFDIDAVELSASSCGKWGLINMRQRAASLGGAFVINSAHKQGTKVSVNIPLKDERL